MQVFSITRTFSVVFGKKSSSRAKLSVTNTAQTVWAVFETYLVFTRRYVLMSIVIVHIFLVTVFTLYAVMM